nr:MAG TPA: hypothetical protein [Caudoviricetes sp.]
MRCRLFLLEKLNLGSDIYCREAVRCRLLDRY